MPEATQARSETKPKFRFNKFFVHRLSNGKILLINDLGRFAVLTREEFASMQGKRLTKKPFEMLEKAHIIATEKNREAIASDYRTRYGHVSEGISLHIVNPTMKCNQNCLYCYANSLPLKSKGHEMGPETAERVLDFIWQSPSPNITIEFQGGEPLANFPAVKRIIETAKARKGKNVHWRIVTNLTMMDDSIAGFLQKNNVLDLCTSFDGPKKVHDSNRPYSKGSSHGKVVHWIKKLRQEYGFKEIGALCTVTKNSLPFAEEIVQSYSELGLRDITLVPLRKIGLASKNWAEIGYGWQQYLSFWKKAVNHCISLSRQGKQISEQIAVLSLLKMNRVEPSHHTCFSKPCGAALMQASYQPDGSIYTCDEAKAVSVFRIGNVDQTYKEVFTSAEALNMVSLSSSLGTACNECRFTGFCRLCPVLTYSTQGSPIPKLALDEDCKLKKAQFEFLLEKLFSEDGEILENWISQKN